jgi:hypothetical protein
MDSSTEALQAFHLLIRNGYHHSAKLIYPLIKSRPEIGFGAMLRKMINLLIEANGTPEIDSTLERYHHTLIFLQEINVKIPIINPDIGLFLAQITGASYHNFGTHPIFIQILEDLVNLGVDFRHPDYLHMCLIGRAIGGLQILSNMNAISGNCYSSLLIAASYRSSDFSESITIIMKHVTLDNVQMNGLFHKYIDSCIQSSYENYWSGPIIQFMNYITDQGYELQINDQILQLILDNRLSVPLMESILKKCSIVNVNQIYRVKRKEIYDLLHSYHINAEIYDRGDDDSSDEVLIG